MNSIMISVFQHIIIGIQKVIHYLKPKKNKEYFEFHKFQSSQYQYILIYVGFKNQLDIFDFSLISDHRKNSAYIIYVSNHADLDLSYDSPVDLFIKNNNEGWDFAMYKTATQYVLENFDLITEKILYINDSSFYLGDLSGNFFKPFLDTRYDFIAPFEVSLFGKFSPWHLSAWCFSVSKDFFLSSEYKKFWDSHIPIRNKIYAIREGEHLLTKTALFFSGKVRALFDNQLLLDNFNSYIASNDFDELLKYLPSAVKNDYVKELTFPLIRDFEKAPHFIDYLQMNAHLYSPAHLFGVLLIKMVNFPFLKKDLFFFNGHSYSTIWLLNSLLEERHGQIVSSACTHIFLLRGRFIDSKIKWKYILGLR